MGTLGTLGAIVPAISQKESAYLTAHFESFLKGVTIPTNIYFAFELCTTIFVIMCMAQREHMYGTEVIYLFTPCQL